MSELNSRQWALYNYLKERGDEWTYQREIALALYDYYDDGESDAIAKFHDSPVRHLMTNDIRAINKSNVIQKVIITGAKGIKLASKDDFIAYLKRQYAALWRRKERIDKIARKGLNDQQMRIVFGHERDTIEAFIDGKNAPK